MGDRFVARTHNWPRAIAISLIVGALVFCTASLVAWQIATGLPYYRYGQIRTLGTFYTFQEAMTDYREQNGQYPADFRTLPELQKRLDDNGELLDGWRRPFVYSPSEDGYRLCSYGEDAVPGGEGLNHDMCVDANGAPNADYINSGPTLRQFMKERAARKSLLASGISGLLAVAVYLQGGRSENVWPPRGAQLAMSMLLTWVFSMFVAAILVVLSSPFGH